MFKSKSLVMLLIMSLLCSMLIPIGTVSAAEIPAEYFEGSAVPAGWSAVDGGSVELSNLHAKHESQSLKWTWSNGSKLQTTSLPNMKEATGPNGGLKVWVYNEKPMEGQYLTFNLGTGEELSAGVPRYTFKFYMNFTGWRTVWLRLNIDAVNPDYNGNAVPTTMEVIAPSTPSSSYIDLFQLTSVVNHRYGADNQAPYLKSTNIAYHNTYRASLKKPSLPEETEITAQQSEDFSTIMSRLDQYIYGENLDYASLPDGPVKTRYNALLAKLPTRIAEYDAYNITRDENGAVHGPGIFSEEDANFGPKTTKFERIWTALVHDYKLNGNEQSKQKFFDLLDHFHDQGWAAGSIMGSEYSIRLRMSGYAYALYLMRDELKAAGKFNREMDSLYWFSKFGDTFDFRPKDLNSDDFLLADELRTVTLYNLMYILMMDDSPEKVRYMKGFLEFVAKQMDVYSGYGMLKPDYTGYHHDGIYMNAYAPDAIFVASLVRYITHGTSFQLDSTTTENIKKYLLVQRSFGNKYDISHSVAGRFPLNPSTLQTQYISYALNALSGDEELKGIFLDLWDPNDPIISANFAARAENSIFYHATLGELQISEEAAARFAQEGITAQSPAPGFKNFNFGAVALFRNDNWLVTTKGFNRYNWDYELDSTNNVFGRYLSHGNTEIVLPGGFKSSGLDITAGWDFNRWPGTTTKHIPILQLEDPKMRYYSDETFGGGVSSEGQHGIFGMKLHDTAFDTTFRANKSWFYFGDQIIALGSDIVNSDTVNRTETTLFQSNMNDTIMPFYNNSGTAIDSFPYSSTTTTNSKVWMVDPYGNGYIIPDANGLRVERGVQESYTKKGASNYEMTQGNYTTAWLDHGTAPQGQGYEYVILPQKTPAEVEAAAQALNYSVLRKDNMAHIVKHNTFNAIGYALFDPTTQLSYGVLNSVDTPVLAMEKTKSAGRIVLSLSDPDLRLEKPTVLGGLEPNLKKPSQSKTVIAKLNGNWRFAGAAPAGVTLAGYDSATDITSFAFECVDGKSFDVELVIAGNQGNPSNDSGSSSPGEEKHVIKAAAGGTVNDSGVRIVVPAGAAPSDIAIRIEQVSNPSALLTHDIQLLSQVFEIKKDKAGDFLKTITITLPFDKSKWDAAKSKISIYWYDEAAKEWVELDQPEIDLEQGVVTGTINHFTKFAVLASNEQKPSEPSADFSDTQGHWAEEGIRELVKAGIINGYQDGTFAPEKRVTRAEFAVILVKAFKLQAKSGAGFADTDSHWAKASIETAAANGIISGYSADSFGPDDPITREQMAAMIVRAAKLPATAGETSFADQADISGWAQAAVAAAAESGLITGYENGSFKPQAHASRAEAVTILLRAMR
ncbi:chondroitinase family polysaccharide lyase [Paenibacillus sp. LHD-117]|uniref:chondroitinase family polysaccharide lyase n=1 Tax=Paenibacillus sp. LHD-117 TaxID=3071412 RepID=UPI0027DF8F36|nr:chondroitinase family polysaccharide lyase [Paenibacillus sp. LHD-117]MDQ6421416.1 chondroitinase family polysaccharide lyase [Paenibacillus sp. LHD-117]